jgi:hypothetical protein
MWYLYNTAMQSAPTILALTTCKVTFETQFRQSAIRFESTNYPVALTSLHPHLECGVRQQASPTALFDCPSSDALGQF